MDVKTQVATSIALKVFDEIKSSNKWEDFIDCRIDWKEIEKLVPNYNLEEMVNEITVNQKPLDELIKELNEQINQQISMLHQSELHS